jgi:hypothetical protein
MEWSAGSRGPLGYSAAPVGPSSSIRECFSALGVGVVVAMLITGCGGGHRGKTTTQSDHSAVFTSQTIDTLRTVRAPTADGVASNLRLVAVYCKEGRRRVNPSRDERAGRALAELKVWLAEPDAVPIVRPAVARLRRRYPTCSALRLLRG